MSESHKDSESGLEPDAKQPPRFQLQIAECLVAMVMLAATLAAATTMMPEEYKASAMLMAFIPSIGCFIWSSIVSSSRKAPHGERFWRTLQFQFVAALCCVMMMGVASLGTRRHHNITTGAVAAKTIAEAQEIYFRRDYDKDGRFEYSPTLAGLFETSPGKDDLGLIARAVRDAEGRPSDKPIPKWGYCFVVLTAQGPNTPGGAKLYTDENGDLTNGYAILVYPATYNPNADYYDRCSFVIDRTGTIYVQDFGKNTAAVIESMRAFDLDTHWKPCE